MRVVFFLLLAPVALLAGCTSLTSTCTLLACDDVITVQYAQGITGAYTLAVSTDSGYSGTVTCPTSSASAQGTLTAGNVFIQCSATGFSLAWAAGQPLGSSTPADGAPIAVTATVTPAGGRAPVTKSASAASTGTTRPNGPSCAPVCDTRHATM